MLGKKKLMRQASVGAICAGLLSSLAGVTRLNAQATATIVGTVTDATGAVIAEASVQVGNVGTGIAQGATSDAQGRYRGSRSIDWRV